MWFICIIIPYRTSYWQVGDSAEQNGCFKMKNTEVKEMLVALKALHGLDIIIEKTDIISIVNYGWLHSFARKCTNKSAVTVRGWNPLNWALLQHPEIASTAAQQAEETPMSAGSFLLEDINTMDESAGDMFDILLSNVDKEQAKKA
jgi:hypothetical protein